MNHQCAEPIKAGQVEYHINETQDFRNPAAEIFQIKDGQHNISSRGYMVTKDCYKDYPLVVDYK